jgi:hypothetical protein
LPVLSHPIVDLAGTYDPASGRLGALDCNYVLATTPDDRWCFNAFGTTAIPGKVIGSFDYKVAAGSEVVAASAGTVERVSDKESADFPGEFEIHIRPSPGSKYLVIYDHVKDIAVAVGQEVVAGARLGTAGIHRTDPKRFGRVELQLNYFPNPRELRETTILCPARFGTPEFVALHESALAAHNAANPAFAAARLCLLDNIRPR